MGTFSKTSPAVVISFTVSFRFIAFKIIPKSNLKSNPISNIELSIKAIIIKPAPKLVKRIASLKYNCNANNIVPTIKLSAAIYRLVLIRLFI